MAFRVTCTTCGTRFALGDDLYERKIKNRLVTIRCRSCSSDISVDGSALEASAANEPSYDANEPVLDSDAMPASGKVPDLTPTVPREAKSDRTEAETQTPTPALEPRAKGAGLWVVCCPDQEDRELTLSEIEQAIAKNEVTSDAIVWRDGMAEWLPIHQVPELRVLLKKPPLPKPKGRTLLGIGAKPRVPSAPVSDPDNEPVSVEPEALSESSEVLAQRKAGPVALSPGLLSVKRKEDDVLPEPPPRRKMDSIPEPPPRRKMDSIPEPPPRRKMDSIPEPPPRQRLDSRPDLGRLPKPPAVVRPVPKVLLEDHGPDSAPDSSGTPNLRSLAAVVPRKPPARDETENQPPVDEFMWQFGGGSSGGTELLGAPTIDVTGLSAPPVMRSEPAPEAPPSSARKKSAKGRKRKAAAAERADADADGEGSEEEVRPATPEADKKTGLWVLIAAAVLVVGGFLLVRGRGGGPDGATEPPLAPAVEPPAAPVTAEPAAAMTAAEPAPPASAAEAVKEVPAEDRGSLSGASAEDREPRPREKEPAERVPSREEAAAEAKPAAADATAKPGAPDKPGEGAEKAPAPAASAEAAPAAEFDREAAAAALNAAAGQASACRKEGDPTGSASVVVTFAPSGRVTSANVNGPPFAGTATGGCIAAAMRKAKVPAFGGRHITVGKTVVIR